MKPESIFPGAVLLAFFVSGAQANYSCSGPVSGVQISPGGVVSAASIAGMSWIYLCSTQGVANGVSVDTCKTIYSTLLTAQVTGKNVTLWFNDDPNTCASHAAWSWASSWYWGPMLD